jgi:CTP:molybdopterin cytidylyltransferase MocA
VDEAPPRSFDALVLAGERVSGDPLARDARVPHKSLLEVGGLPMLVRVVSCLAATPGVGRVWVSAGDPALLEAHPELVRLRDAGVLAHRASAESPAASVQELLSGAECEGPLLVTTSDHPLLAPEMIEHFCRESATSGADVVAAVVADGVFRARFPRARRTFIPLRGEAVTGANLFWFRSGAGAAAAGFWRRTESIRKKPWRLASLLGPVMLLRFALRRVTLEAATERLSQILGLRVAALRLPYPECGLDVDRADDLVLAERTIAEAGG